MLARLDSEFRQLKRETGVNAAGYSARARPDADPGSNDREIHAS